MGDVFKEQIIKRKPTFRDTLFRILLIVAAGLVFMIAFIFVPAFGAIIGFAAIFGAWFAMSYLNVEYEYVFTNGELDIDIIYNRSRRKRIFSQHVNKFDIMAHIDDNARAGEFSGAQEVRNYTSGETNENTYAFLTTLDSKRVKVIIEPNEKMLKAIATVLTRRKLFVKQ
ncbi:MAG: DUF6106 family protein [Defluviitaleaceae bacterium]|nr:DUF6106 family protein [Defluviitaleaceae bacterium]